jgi:hypothetical protein
MRDASLRRHDPLVQELLSLLAQREIHFRKIKDSPPVTTYCIVCGVAMTASKFGQPRKTCSSWHRTVLWRLRKQAREKGLDEASVLASLPLTSSPAPPAQAVTTSPGASGPVLDTGQGDHQPPHVDPDRGGIRHQERGDRQLPDRGERGDRPAPDEQQVPHPQPQQVIPRGGYLTPAGADLARFFRQGSIV